MNQAKINKQNTKQHTEQLAVNKSEQISIKELFERVVILETKLDLMNTTNAKTSIYFKRLAVLIIILETINFGLNVILTI